MWWNGQNLDKPRKDKTGKRWNFRVWHDSTPLGHAERIFFWDDKKEHAGVILLTAGSSVHVSRVHRQQKRCRYLPLCSLADRKAQNLAHKLLRDLRSIKTTRQFLPLSPVL